MGEGETLLFVLFVNGADVSTTVQSMRHTDFKFLTFRSTNCIAYLLADSLTSRISYREESAFAKKTPVSQHTWIKEREKSDSTG